MRTLLLILLTLTITFSPNGGFMAVPFSAMKQQSDVNTALTNFKTAKQAEIVAAQQAALLAAKQKADAANPYGIGSLLQIDITGYCNISYPQTHFDMTASSTTDGSNGAQLQYKDNKSRIVMGYTTGIPADTDIPGYITIKKAGVNTTTNNSSDFTFNNVQWHRIVAVTKDTEQAIYIWYTASEDESSVFWLKASVERSTDGDEFEAALESILNSYDPYYTNDTVFGNPGTGFYKDGKLSSDSDASEFKKNDSSKTVLNSDQHSFLSDVDISDDWESMEIMIDNTKFTLPCPQSDFYDAGFSMNDRSVNIDNQLAGGSTYSFKIINKYGTVVNLTVANPSTQSVKITDCAVVMLSLNTAEFTDLSSTLIEDRGTTSGNDTTAQSTSGTGKKVVIDKEANIRDKDNTSGKILKPTAQPGEEFEYVETMPDSGWYHIKYDGQDAYVSNKLTEIKDTDGTEQFKAAQIDKHGNVTEDATAQATDSTDQLTEDDTSGTDSSTDSTEDSTEESTESTDDTTNSNPRNLIGPDDKELHGLVLPGGVTWNSYNDDIIGLYGTDVTKTYPTADTVQMVWKHNGLSLTLITYRLYGIKSVIMSTASN